MDFAKAIILNAVFGAAALAAAETVVNPGAGVATNIAATANGGDIVVKSGIVSASMDPQYGGTLKVESGTLTIGDFGAPSREMRVKAKWTGGSGGAAVPFKVRKSEESTWFSVSPASGVISPQQSEVEFTVTLDPARMTDRRRYHGIFFVAATNGLSRPVSFVAETDYVPPFYAREPSATTIYADVVHPVSGSAPEGEAEYAFNVAKAGKYYFMVHCAAETANYIPIQAAVDGDAYAESQQQTKAYPTWTMLTPGKEFGDYLRVYELSAGRHTVRIKADYTKFPYDGVVLTDSPGDFEPR